MARSGRSGLMKVRVVYASLDRESVAGPRFTVHHLRPLPTSRRHQRPGFALVVPRQKEGILWGKGAPSRWPRRSCQRLQFPQWQPQHQKRRHERLEFALAMLCEDVLGSDCLGAAADGLRGWVCAPPPTPSAQLRSLTTRQGLWRENERGAGGLREKERGESERESEGEREGERER